MASIQKRPGKTGIRYVVKWYDPATGSDRSISINPETGRPFTSREANAFKARVEVAKHGGPVIADPRGGKTTLATYGATWLDRQRDAAPSTRRNHEAALRLRIAADPIGKMPLAAIQPAHVEAWVDRHEGMKPGTLRLNARTLQAILKAAVRDRLIATSPASGLRLEKEAWERKRAMTPAEVGAIARAAEEPYRTMILILAETGLRMGELLGLVADRIVWKRTGDASRPRASLIIDQQLPPNPNDAQTESGHRELKTPHSYRTVELSTVTARRLEAHMAENPPLAPYGFVFYTSRRPGPISHNHFDKTYRRARVQAGAPAWATIHRLRHYHASLLIEQGWKQSRVAERLGHTVEMCREAYLDLWRRHEAETEDAVDLLYVDDHDEAA